MAGWSDLVPGPSDPNYRLHAKLSDLERRLAAMERFGNEKAAIGAGRSATTGGALSGAFGLANMPLTILKTAGGAPVQLAVTPAYDCWWPVYGHILVSKGDAAWHRLVVDILLAPNDPDGSLYSVASDDIMHNSGAADLAGGTVAALFKLTAGVAYTATLRVSGVTGGSWGYFRQEDRTYINSPGIIAR